MAVTKRPNGNLVIRTAITVTPDDEPFYSQILELDRAGGRNMSRYILQSCLNGVVKFERADKSEAAPLDLEAVGIEI